MFVEVIGEAAAAPIFGAVNIEDTEAVTIGIVTSKSSATSCTVTTYGVVGVGGIVIVPGNTYYVGPDSRPGPLTAPSVAPILAQEIGLGLTSDKILISLQSPVILTP